MSKSWGKPTGPWGFWGKLDSIWTLGGWPLAWRFEITEEAGVFLNVASPLFGTLVVGVYPDHHQPGCVTGFGVVRSIDASPIEPHHYCWASKLPQIALGPEPRDLEDVGRERAFRYHRLLDRIEARLVEVLR